MYLPVAVDGPADPPPLTVQENAGWGDMTAPNWSRARAENDWTLPSATSAGGRTAIVRTVGTSTSP